jgi:transcriptional regulator with PAS, ATPase and Fis domain
MFCGNCGAKTEGKSRFCRSCGKPVKTGAAAVKEIYSAFRDKKFDMIPGLINSIEDEMGPETAGRFRGSFAFVRGNYNEAYSFFSAIKPKKRNWEDFFNMALIDISSGRSGDALKNLRAIPEMEVKPESSILYSSRYSGKKEFLGELYLYLGVLYKNMNDRDNAVGSFEKSMEYGPSGGLAGANLGDIYFAEGNYDGAIKYYKEALDTGSDDMKKSHIYNDLGLAYFRNGLIDEAVESFKKAIFLNSGNKNAVYNLGLIYVKSGMQDRVKDDYKEFLKHESGIDIVFNLSRSIMDVAKQESSGGDSGTGLLGSGASMKKVREMIAKAAASDSTVFIHGENGTGKELAARAIHASSARADKPFIVVNCAAMPETLLESELFGYEKGAFTGAVREKPGRFELADKGTVFLDEIGDITPSMQVKLLRFVQEREFERVGGTKTIKVDIRIITATNKDIKAMVKSGLFREDLYYRLYVVPLYMPPLRERVSDIMFLAAHFLAGFSAGSKKEFTGFSQEAASLLNSYQWPGNVRQLENVIERIATLHDGPVVKAEYLPEEFIKNTDAAKKAADGRDELRVVLDALEASKYSKTNAAKYLGISRVALWKKMKKLGIK